MLDGLIRGAIAGAAGTAVMTLMMKQVASRVMPADMLPDEFAPKRVVEWAEEQAGEPNALTDSQEQAAAMGAHFGYGSGSGAVYGLLRETLINDVPAPVAGVIFGVAVWAVSFQGWMPALGVQEATTDQPPRKWPAPIMMHMVYGASTALAYEALEDVL